MDSNSISVDFLSPEECIELEKLLSDYQPTPFDPADPALPSANLALPRVFVGSNTHSYSKLNLFWNHHNSSYLKGTIIRRHRYLVRRILRGQTAQVSDSPEREAVWNEFCEASENKELRDLMRQRIRRGYFSAASVRKSYFYCVEYLFTPLSPEYLSRLFRAKCCSGNHQAECFTKWSDLRQYLQFEILANLGFMPWTPGSD